jgi:hypothetical protein
MSSYLFVVLYASGQESESWVDAINQSDARKKLWATLTDSQKNNVEDIECVDIQQWTASW